MDNPKNEVLAEVKGKKFLRSDVIDYINLVNAKEQFLNEKGILQVANEMVNQHLLYLDAMEKGYDKEEDFLKILNETKENLLKNYATQKLFKDITVTEDEMRDYYKKNPEQFISEETYKIKHILVKECDTAEMVLRKIENGENFELLAKKYSIDESKSNGGNLGEVPLSALLKEFKDVLKELKEGEVSKPVKTAYGWHLIYLDHTHPKVKYDFETVKEHLRQQIILLKRQEAYVKKCDDLRLKNDVKINF